MKKYCLVTILLTLLMSMPMFAYDFVQNGIYYNIEDDHVSVTYSGNGVYSGSVSIPSQVTYDGVTYPVTAIGEWAFEGGEGMTSLTIPSSITSIGEYAFIDCGSNINVTINDLKAWCKVTFGNEHSSPLSSAKNFYSGGLVTSLIIPDGVESIPNFAFYQCRSITFLNIPSSVKSIGSSAFEDCTGLKSAYFTEGVESIGGSSFEGCTNLSTIILPSSLTSIAINAFRNCTSLNTVASWIENPFALDENVFSTYSTATLIVPEGATAAYQSTDGWNLFTNITDDPSEDPTVRTIHVATAGTLSDYISDSKYLITDLTLTGELNGTDFGFLREMAGKTIYGRYGRYLSTGGLLRVLDISNLNIKAGGNYYKVWGATDDDESDYYYLRTDNTLSEVFEDCTNLTTIILPNNLTSIGSSTFKGCSNLTSITIPESVTSIGHSAFENTGWYNNQANGLLYLDNWLLGYKGDKPVGELIITEGTKGIAGAAFYECSSQTSVTIPNSVTYIGEYAFMNCSGLTSVTIGNSVTQIGYAAFCYCSGLTSVTIPNSVTSIGDFAFYNCSSLTSIKVESGNEKYDSRNNCNAIIETISNTLIVGCENTTIPNSVTSIGSSAFYNCSGLTSITIPNSVTSIGDQAFRGCSGLTSIVSLNSNPPSLQYSSVFYNVDKNICVVWVPKGSLSAYKGAAEWKDFANIFELVEGDLNLDDVVDQNDMDALVGFVMGENPEGFYEGLADLNGDNKIDAADVVKMVDMVRASSGLGTVSQFVIENSVVSSLTCTLNNERSEAIQLTKCELYCNHNLVSYESFLGASASVAAGGSKQCTFNNLAKLNSSTGFTVCWYYTANGKNYVYRCPLKE